MYVSLGAGRFARKDEVIGVFDLDITSQSKITREFLQNSEKNKKVINATEDLPKSFVLVQSGEVYVSQPSTSTLIKRIEEISEWRIRN